MFPLGFCSRSIVSDMPRTTFRIEAFQPLSFSKIMPKKSVLMETEGISDTKIGTERRQSGMMETLTSEALRSGMMETFLHY